MTRRTTLQGPDPAAGPPTRRPTPRPHHVPNTLRTMGRMAWTVGRLGLALTLTVVVMGLTLATRVDAASVQLDATSRVVDEGPSITVLAPGHLEVIPTPGVDVVVQLRNAGPAWRICVILDGRADGTFCGAATDPLLVAALAPLDAGRHVLLATLEGPGFGGADLRTSQIEFNVTTPVADPSREAEPAPVPATCSNASLHIGVWASSRTIQHVRAWLSSPAIANHPCGATDVTVLVPSEDVDAVPQLSSVRSAATVAVVAFPNLQIPWFTAMKHVGAGVVADQDVVVLLDSHSVALDKLDLAVAVQTFLRHGVHVGQAAWDGLGIVHTPQQLREPLTNWEGSWVDRLDSTFTTAVTLVSGHVWPCVSHTLAGGCACETGGYRLAQCTQRLAVLHQLAPALLPVSERDKPLWCAPSCAHTMELKPHVAMDLHFDRISPHARELILYILWSEAARVWPSQLTTICGTFHCAMVQRLKWQSHDDALNNLWRLYGGQTHVSWDMIEAKLQRVGAGEFLLVLASDPYPNHGQRYTTAGLQYVNTRAFDVKQHLRRTTCGDCVHSSINQTEALRDSMYFLGASVVEELLSSLPQRAMNVEAAISASRAGSVQANPYGSGGWANIVTALNFLGYNTPYAVLRNAAEALDGLGHTSDLDLIVENVKAAKLSFGVPHDSGTQFYVPLSNGNAVLVQLYTPGDGYAPEAWQLRMLHNRQCTARADGVCTVHPVDEAFGMLYHATMYKGWIKGENVWQIRTLVGDKHIDLSPFPGAVQDLFTRFHVSRVASRQSTAATVVQFLRFLDITPPPQLVVLSTMVSTTWFVGVSWHLNDSTSLAVFPNDVEVAAHLGPTHLPVQQIGPQFVCASLRQRSVLEFGHRSSGFAGLMARSRCAELVMIATTDQNRAWLLGMIVDIYGWKNISVIAVDQWRSGVIQEITDRWGKPRFQGCTQLPARPGPVAVCDRVINPAPDTLLWDSVPWKMWDVIVLAPPLCNVGAPGIPEAPHVCLPPEVLREGAARAFQSLIIYSLETPRLFRTAAEPVTLLRDETGNRTWVVADVPAFLQNMQSLFAHNDPMFLSGRAAPFRYPLLHPATGSIRQVDANPEWLNLGAGLPGPLGRPYSVLGCDSVACFARKLGAVGFAGVPIEDQLNDVTAESVASVLNSFRCDPSSPIPCEQVTSVAYHAPVVVDYNFTGWHWVAKDSGMIVKLTLTDNAAKDCFALQMMTLHTRAQPISPTPLLTLAPRSRHWSMCIMTQLTAVRASTLARGAIADPRLQVVVARNALHILKQLRALEIMHRDINAPNIFVDPYSGRLWLYDFEWFDWRGLEVWDPAFTVVPVAFSLGRRDNVDFTGRPADFDICDVYGMGTVLRWLLGPHSVLQPLVQAMLQPTREARTTDIAALELLLASAAEQVN